MKQLISLISTKGKSPEVVYQEIADGLKKFQEGEKESQPQKAAAPGKEGEQGLATQNSGE